MRFLACFSLWSLALNSWNADLVEFIFVLNTIGNISKCPYGLDKYFASAYCICELDEEEQLWLGESWTFFFI